MIPLLPALAACVASVPASDCDLSGPHLVVVGVDPRFTASGLAAVDPETGCVADGLDPGADLGPDPIVRALRDTVAVISRSGGDAIHVYDRGHYDARVDWIEVEAGTNVHDLVQVGDLLLATEYDGTGVLALGIDGEPRFRIDLTDQADADGYPEPDRIVWIDGAWFVSVQRLSRATVPWAADVEGRLVELDLGARLALDGRPLGLNPRVVAGPDALGLATGIFGQPDGAAAIVVDGAVQALHSEVELGMDVTHVIPVGGHAVVVGVSFDWEQVRSSIVCIDLASGAVVKGLDADTWWVDAVPMHGAVIVAGRRQGSGTGDASLLRVTPEDCGVDRMADGFRLDPYDLAVVP